MFYLQWQLNLYIRYNYEERLWLPEILSLML